MPSLTCKGMYTDRNYVVASKCSRNHFISEKYKTVKSFKLHLLQNRLLAQIYTFASDCSGVGNIPGSHCVKHFQLFRRILNDVSNTIKAPSLQRRFQWREQVKSPGARSGEYGGRSSVVTLFFDKKSLTKTDRCAGALP